MHPPTQPRFIPHELAAHQFELTDLLKQIMPVTDFCAANAAQIDRNGAFPVEEFELIAQAGLLTAPLARAWGGLGLGIDASSISHPQAVALVAYTNMVRTASRSVWKRSNSAKDRLERGDYCPHTRSSGLFAI
jgi:alkylation response protein AidB-like acyl-CoA dehydrogenase